MKCERQAEMTCPFSVTKSNKLDDRSYCLAIASYALSLRRAKDRLNRAGKKKKSNWIDDIPITKGKSVKYF